MLDVPWTSGWYTIVFLLASAGCSAYGDYQTQITGQYYSQWQPPMFDIVHANLPDLSAYSFLNTVWLMIAALRFVWLRQNLNQFGFLMGVALLLRIFPMNATAHPTPIPQCFDHQSPLVMTGFADGLVVLAQFYLTNACYNLMFSGHTVLITLSCTGICRDTAAHRLEKLGWILYLAAACLWIAMSRQHYTEDVIVGLYIGGLLALSSWK